MRPFQIIPGISEYGEFRDFAKDFKLCERDLILTNEYIYAPSIAGTEIKCRRLFQEKYGTGEPTDRMVDAILNDLREISYDRIIAVGGGTIIDIAKVLAVAGKDDCVDDLYDRMQDLKKEHSLIAVPTTCGTGSEMTGIAVINRTAKGVKQGLVSLSMFADQAVLIPGLLSSLPYGVFATSSIDAMIHAVESYLSPNACVLSELFSVEALKLILPCWMSMVYAENRGAWKNDALKFLRASNYAGIAFNYAGCAAVHALSYPLGGAYHVAHGESNQVMFAPVLKKYKEKRPDGKLEGLEDLIGSLLDCERENALNELFKLMDAILRRKPMKAYGVKREELSVYTDSVIETQRRLLKNNYVPLSYDEILSIYEAAF